MTARSPEALSHFSAGTRRRLTKVLALGMLWGFVLNPAFEGVSMAEVMGRTLCVGLGAWTAFEVIGRWPTHLPDWLARWALQVLAVAAAIPLGALAVYLVVTQGDPQPLWKTPDRLSGMGMISGTGLLFGPWIAVTALIGQIRGEAERLTLRLNLQNSEHQRQAMAARLQLLQAQVQPHFLFNTLANVRELVESRSPQAATVLNSLIAYLRAAVPRLEQTGATLQQELDLVRAYLEVMQMRIPDRLQFSLHADADTLDLPCLPMSLLTLVENAVRHGIDPCEEGGRIDVRVRLHQQHVRLEVTDTGVGLQAAESIEGLGSGLANLRERLQLHFGNAAQLRLLPLRPRGTCAEIEFPLETTA